VPHDIPALAATPSPWRRSVILWMTLGILLHALLIVFPRQRDDDTDAYLELGRNLFHHGTYGFMDDGVVSPALFRLPGYPIFLELLGERMTLIFVAQSLIGLAGCLLLALFLRRYWSDKAGLAALALSATCLFTATYAATELTESLSIFAVAAAIYCLGELFAKPAAFALSGWFLRLLPLASTAMLAMLLRPDGALLTFSIALALTFYGLRRTTPIQALRTAALFVLLAATPLVPWTIRNAVTFHVFQPLAPRHVNDPGERVNLGFYRWLRTWSIDFDTTSTVFWKIGTEQIKMEDLPPRAFDSPAQRAETDNLIAAYNQTCDISQPLDDRFAALAETRIKSHPLRYFVWVPTLRVADMWLRPRTEGIPISPAWWRWNDHPIQSAAALAFGLLNLGYILLALGGALRSPPLAIFLTTYSLLRCLLLATLENPEPRYTLEAFPIVFVLGAILLGGAKVYPCAPPSRS
jgi:4-amino-4-deoxy-L-arabinose transferase-like glycosyltransferase